jgi:hypothetical protein
VSRLRLSCLALAVFAVGLSAPDTAAVEQPNAYRIVWDDFQHGFSDSGPEARWSMPDFGSLKPNDGITTTSSRGLQVVPKGVNPQTGEPAFTLTAPQDPNTGGLDHVKWMALTAHTASTGQPGFDAVPGQELSCETWLAARTYGTAAHPFGPLVEDPEDDLRLASAAMNAADLETEMIFDFFVTNRRIYAFYERGPYMRATLGDYAAFSFAIPVADNKPGQQHHLRIGYDRSAGIVRWYVDGSEVYRVNRIGHHIEREHMMIDYGGTETLVEPRQLNCGMGLFSVLDGGVPGAPGTGLVRLSNAESHYFDPPFGEPSPQTFHDDRSQSTSRLFGQGASLNMRRYVVSSLPVRGHR